MKHGMEKGMKKGGMRGGMPGGMMMQKKEMDDMMKEVMSMHDKHMKDVKKK